MKGLIHQSRVDVKRLLVIGGVSLNEAFIKLLREELIDVDVVVKEISPVFEAYGAALLAKDSPTQKSLDLKTRKSFTTLPILQQFSDKVTIFEPTIPKKDFDKNSPLILGVDVGSTTTKAVLLDASDLSIVASHYGRTQSNPVRAARQCVREIISQTGNCKVNLVGVTGSGRQIVGAYFGTEAVYNEISAHSQGAVFFDKDVDTVFEIGGQDSKYMFLQNGVPVDYAMNASCSAGTGSFLEESAKGDLGVEVYDISQIAIEAENPIRFQADCAAFINTDIRTAFQEEYGRDDIIGGLVYSIVDNYLNKVKGSRAVGKKVFFQGGVAKNHSVGYAFAQATGKEIIIPPNPELIGAFGIALIAKSKFEEHEINSMSNNTTLESLIQEDLKHLKSIVCKSCKNYCQIERYEVGGRKFLFGGSCTKYEHQWKGSEKVIEKEDYVTKRNDLLFDVEAKKISNKKRSKGKIGIPRALLTHSVYPLFSTFFKELGYEVILSGIDEDKELMTNASFCYPVQILHGAVLDLVKQGINTVFMPHITNLTKGEKWLEASFCPITQASPYFITKAFEEIEFLKPILDFLEGYEQSTSLIDMAVNELLLPTILAKEAYEKAVAAQLKVENQFLQWGKEILEDLENTGDIGIILVGRSYNAFPQETSLSIPKKLASMGVTVIPFDFLEKTEVADIPWYFPNYVKIAVDLARENDNLFLLYINSFSCTIDAFIQNYARTEIGSKPYLLLELDAHTADAGIQTRLEAFLEIITNYSASKKITIKKPFQVAKMKKRNGKLVVITSDGKTLDARDPRVILNVPPHSLYHTDLMVKLFSSYGFNVGKSVDINIDFITRGLRVSSGKECIPLPIVLGHMLTVYENRKPGEVLGFYMIRGGAPCAVYSYFHYIEQFIEQHQLKDVFLYRFDLPTGYLGISPVDMIRYGAVGVLLGDLMHEIRSALHVVGEEGCFELLDRYWYEFLDELTSLKLLKKCTDRLVNKIATIPRTGSPANHPKVLVSGDFFVRFSDFFLKEMRDIYTKHGIIVKSTDYFELNLYSMYFVGGYLMSKEWNRDPEKFSTLLLASATLWYPGSRQILQSRLTIKNGEIVERRERKRFERTGLLFAGPNDLKAIFKHAAPLISPLIFGEAIPTIGKGMETLEASTFDSLILAGPLNCLPHKVSQAILKPIYLDHHTPFLVFDVDASALSPNMKRLINSNIEQIKRRRQTGKRAIMVQEIMARRRRRWARKEDRKKRKLNRFVDKKERRWTRIQKNREIWLSRKEKIWSIIENSTERSLNRKNIRIARKLKRKSYKKAKREIRKQKREERRKLRELKRNGL